MKALVTLAALIFISARPALADDIGKPGANDGPPQGITPVTTKLQTVLDANDAAVGSVQHKSISEVEEGTISGYGITGKYCDVSQNEYDVKITSDKYGVNVGDADLAITPTRPNFVQFPAGKSEIDLRSDISVESLPYNLSSADPLIRVTINGRGLAIGDHFVLSTTSPGTELFSGFWSAHPDDVKDQGRGRSLNFGFLGSDSIITATHVRQFLFGSTRFMEWLTYEVHDDNFVEGLGWDGIIGYDFLQYFNVYFDYPHHLIYLQPNDVFKRFAT